MSVIAVTVYEVYCDHCGEQLESSDYAAFYDPGDYLVYACWIEDEGIHVCETCAASELLCTSPDECEPGEPCCQGCVRREELALTDTGGTDG